jgi:cell division septal protein FtsQ
MPKKEILIPSRRLRRKKLIAKAIIVFGIFLLSFAGFVGFFYIPKFRVSHIAVLTDSVISKAVLIESQEMMRKKKFGIFPLNNILLFPKESIEENILKKNLRVKRIVFDRIFPNSVFISFTERKAEAVWCAEENMGEGQKVRFSEKNKCFFIDKHGIIFDEAPFFSKGIFLKIIGGHEGDLKLGDVVLNGGDFTKILELKDYIQNSLDFKPETVFLKNDDIYEIYLDRGWKIIFDLENSVEETFDNLKILLEEIGNEEQNLEYADFRFSNKVFYKFKRP